MQASQHLLALKTSINLNLRGSQLCWKHKILVIRQFEPLMMTGMLLQLSLLIITMILILNEICMIQNSERLWDLTKEENFSTKTWISFKKWVLLISMIIIANIDLSFQKWPLFNNSIQIIDITDVKRDITLKMRIIENTKWEKILMIMGFAITDEEQSSRLILLILFTLL